MNPLTNVRNIAKLSERELKYNDGKTSWHDEYRDSAWIFIGGLPYDLTEGDIIAVFSQYGEPVNLNLIRDKVTGKSKGFGFLCYEDQKSTILAVDNFNAIKISGRTIRVDHVKDYKPPKDSDKLDDVTRNLHITGCGPGVQLPGLEPPPSNSSIKRERGDDDDYLLPYEPIKKIKKEERDAVPKKKKRDDEKDIKKAKKAKKDRKHKKSKSKKSKKSKNSSSSSKNKKNKRKESSSSGSSSDSESDSSNESESDRNRRKRK
ncbi:RNA-binding motif protein, X-linked 2 [Folsomia candida]|uniref:RNA-binding motif protein, X-linked 2 n=1 Tax=Folsomia candida TaxID=158441 RepID=UPI000B8F35EA|nr:RNA-binding motif protein, X-linked 2 [Folsomia candida]